MLLLVGALNGSIAFEYDKHKADGRQVLRMELTYSPMANISLVGTFTLDIISNKVPECVSDVLFSMPTSAAIGRTAVRGGCAMFGDACAKELLACFSHSGCVLFVWLHGGCCHHCSWRYRVQETAVQD